MFSVKCPFCGFEGVYSPGDAFEEGVIHFECKSCGTRLFAVVESGCRVVECPICKSEYRVCAGGAVETMKLESYVPSAIVASALLGAIIGGATALGEKDRGKANALAKIVASGLMGFLVGTIIGLILESVIRVPEREVVYKGVQVS